MSKMRKMVVMVLVLAMVVQFSYCGREISAATTVSAASVSLKIRDRKATCKANVIGKSGVTKIKGTLKLKKIVNKKTSTVKTWDISVKSSTMSMSKTYSTGQGQYKVVLSVDVYKGSSVQHVTISQSSFSL